ncbi:MAG: hypothetical protein M3Y20_02430 [Actinomycetota bacterium]|nr:hypothetical protein [Actinomycetota bacterium]
MAALVLAAGCGGGEPTITGKLRHLDDTGIAPFPIEEGTILALPAGEGAGARLAAMPDGELRHLSELVEESAVLAEGGAWQPLGRGGRFTLPVAPGEWVLCWADEGASPESGRTRGCSVVTLEAGSRIAASFGEGGVGATAE